MSRDENRDDVRAVLAGDPAAFDGIVRRWQGPLVNLAYRFCRDRGRAEDLAQDAFLRAYRKLDTWREDSAFSTWLFALALNVYRSELRRIPPRSISIEDIGELRDQRPPLGGVDVEDRDRAVRASVHALPPNYRDAMIVFYFHGMDVPAAARSLGVAEGTLKARLFRGRELLRKKLSVLLSAPRVEEAR